MVLIGMLDSPFVRRTAIGLNELGLDFAHKSLSVFRDYAEFKTFNPFVKAPSLVLDSGEVLVDSSLILQYAEHISKQSLYAQDAKTFAIQQQIIGCASIASEKTVQIHYENELREAEKRSQDWLSRIHDQLNDAYRTLDSLVTANPTLFQAEHLSHASISVAVVWYFTQTMRPELIDANDFPALVTWSSQAEKTTSFQAFPYDNSMS